VRSRDREIKRGRERERGGKGGGPKWKDGFISILMYSCFFLTLCIVAVTRDERQDARAIRHVQPELEGWRIHNG